MTVGEILDDDPMSGAYEAPDGLWWFGWKGKDYGPFEDHEDATNAMASYVDGYREEARA